MKGAFQEWNEPCHKVFGKHKSKFSSPPMLKSLEFEKPFEVHTDASDFAIAEVLMQNERSIAHESKKWNNYIYKSSNGNVFLDALSRREESQIVSMVKALHQLYKGERNLQRKIKEKCMNNPKCKGFLVNFIKARF